MKQFTRYFPEERDIKDFHFHRFQDMLEEVLSNLTNNSAWTVDEDFNFKVKTSLQVVDSDDKGLYWREFHVSPTNTSPGASGPTLSVGGAGSATVYYLLNATNEYLYFDTDMHHDWDESSDIVVQVEVALNAGETANDTIDAEIIVDYAGDHENMDTSKTQTRTVAHDIISDNNAGDIHKITFIIDYDLADNIVKDGDNMAFRFRLSSVASVAAVRFLSANVLYRTKYPALEIESFPEEG